MNAVKDHELHMLRKIMRNLDKFIVTLRTDGFTPIANSPDSIARHLERIQEDEV